MFSRISWAPLGVLRPDSLFKLGFCKQRFSFLDCPWILLILHHALPKRHQAPTGDVTASHSQVSCMCTAFPAAVQHQWVQLAAYSWTNCNNSHIQSGVCNFIRLTVIGGSIKLKRGLTGSITSSRSFKTSPFSSTWELGLSTVKHLGTLWSPYLTGTTCDISKMTSVLAAVAVVFL